jgi:hypothetical protein
MIYGFLNTDVSRSDCTMPKVWTISEYGLERMPKEAVVA